MFEKAKLSFKNKVVFGANFKSSIDDCFCKLSRMLFAGKIQHDGTILTAQSDAFTLSELWSYVYYIFYYNNSDLQEFKAMKSANGKSNAVLFYEVVATVVKKEVETELKPLKTIDLVNFINTILDTYKDELVNPVFDYLKVLTEKRALIDQIKLKVGDAPILTGQAARNANIKLTLAKTI